MGMLRLLMPLLPFVAPRSRWIVGTPSGHRVAHTGSAPAHSITTARAAPSRPAREAATLYAARIRRECGHQRAEYSRSSGEDGSARVDGEMSSSAGVELCAAGPGRPPCPSAAPSGQCGIGGA